MGRLWNLDSPFVQKMTTITNLIILNILWLICSLPLITIGASTAAMYRVTFLYHRKETDSVIKPFFLAFRENFKQATILWIIIVIISAILGIDALYILSNAGESQLLLWVPFAILSVLTSITASYGFAQIAIFQNTLPAIVRNGINLFVLNLIPSIAIIMINLLPILLLLFFPEVFLASLILWTLLGFSVSAYVNSYLLKKVFQKYIIS